MMNKCLYCCGSLQGGLDFHNRCSKDFFGTTIPPKLPYSLNQMAELAKNVVERSVTVPGVQAKLSISLIKKTQENSDTRFTVAGTLGGNYILKPPSEQFPEMPQYEHLTMRIAESFNIPVVTSSLIRLESGELSYISRRVDRLDNGKKIHMLDMFQCFQNYRRVQGNKNNLLLCRRFTGTGCLNFWELFDATNFGFFLIE